MWCEKGYPDMCKRKLRGYGLGAAPPGHWRELIVCTFRKHGKLARTTSSALRPASAPIHTALDAAETGLRGDHARRPAPHTPHAHSTCPFAHRHGQCTRLRTAQVTWHAGMTAVDQLAHLACHSLLSFWNLLSTQESSAASHKCHFRVRHFGRVFDLPFKNTLGESLHLVHCCISALREKGSAGFEPRPSSSSTSFSARMIPRRSRCHLLLMPSSLPPLPRCSCAVLPHRHRAAPTFPSPLPSDAALPST